MRIGMGYDVHRLQEGCKLIMGGVEIPVSIFRIRIPPIRESAAFCFCRK